MLSRDIRHYRMLNVSAADCAILQISHGHVTMHHCKLSQLITINLCCVTTVLIIRNATVSKSQNVKDRSHANKYLRKSKVNL